jgi:proton glutamate symport protein
LSKSREALTGECIQHTFAAHEQRANSRLGHAAMKNKLLAAVLATATIAIVASVLDGWHVVSLPAAALETLRWLAIALIAAHAWTKRSLTGWIVVGLLAGAELGHDWPAVAEKLQ